MMVYIPDKDAIRILKSGKTEKEFKEFCRSAVREKIERDGLIK